ncbi:MAG: helix-turn-helix transcriptional regulator [Lewinella sp.]
MHHDSSKRKSEDEHAYGIPPEIRSDLIGDIAGVLDQSHVFVYATDYRTQRFKFLSKGIRRVLGYRHDDWQRRGLEAITAAISAPDRRSFLKIRQHVRHTVRTTPPEKRSDLHFSYLLRCQTSDDRGVWLAFHQTVVCADSSGNLLVDIVVVTDVSAFSPRKSGTLSVSMTTEGGTTSPLETVVYQPQVEVVFSDRELDVLRLVARGHSSREIADSLFITYNTVSTHRKKMMRKAGVRRAMDLVSYARDRGLIEEA